MKPFLRIIQRFNLLFVFTICVLFTSPCFSQTEGNPYSQWKNGPYSEESFFPIGVWLQQPRKSPQFQKAGFNLYVGLWQGPTEEQLATLKQHGMRVFCHQNEVGLQHKDDPIIAGWIQQDEPDNAQPVTDPETGERGYGPPVDPEAIVSKYETLKQNDPSRPVFLNLGQGLANDEWLGRGAGFDNESYYTYAQGCDILSFDVYPVVGIRKENGEDYLWYIAKGLERLKKYSRGEKILWNFVECTHISNPNKKATPAQVRAEVWMSIIHGSKGILYFVHQFEPTFNESALLDDPEMLAEVTELNHEIQDLAPVLYAPTRDDLVDIQLTDPNIPVDYLAKVYDGALYLFTICMRNQPTEATIAIHPSYNHASLESLDEDTQVPEWKEGTMKVHYKPYEVKRFTFTNQSSVGDLSH